MVSTPASPQSYQDVDIICMMAVCFGLVGVYYIQCDQIQQCDLATC